MKYHHRRTLALVLAACMLLSSMIYTLPVLASPGDAMTSVKLEPSVLPEEGSAGFSTSLRDNMWAYDSAACAITYRGGWSAGYMTAAGYAPFSYVNSSSHTWLMRDVVSQWDSPAGTIDRNSLEMHAAKGEGFATVLAYTAPVSGTMTFSLDSFIPSEGNFFAIFVGQRMVFPATNLDFSVADHSSWFAITGMSGEVEINRELDNLLVPVNEGETVSFAFRRGTGTQMYAYPRVTYRTANAPAITSSRFNFKGENFPTYGNNGAFYLINNCGDNWSIGSIPRDGSAPYIPFTKLDSTFCIINRGGNDQWVYGGLYLQNGVVITANNYITIFSYEAPASGRVSVRVGNITATQSNGEDMLFCILKNEQMIWPQNGGSLTDYSHWYNLTAEGASASQATGLSATLQDVRVTQGDRIQYCFVARNGHSMTTKDLDLTVSYISVDSSLPRPSTVGSSLADNYPLMRDPAQGGGLLAFRGRWQYAAAARGDAAYTTLTTTDEENNFLPGKDKSEGYLATSYQGASAAGLCPGERYDLLLTYEVRYSGRIKLDLAAFGEGGEYDVTVKRNDKTIEALTGNAGVVGSRSYELAVSAGDILSFRVSLPEGQSEGVPLYLTPTITYTTLSDRVAITGVSMMLTSDLSVRIYTAAAESYFEAKEHGLLVWRAPQENYDTATELAEVVKAEASPKNTCCYVYTGLDATDMGENVYVRPYIKTAEGQTLYGGVVRFSIFDYATALYGADSLRNRMITDLLVYGAAAQRFFEHATTDLVTDRLSSAQLACGTQQGALFTGSSSLSEPDKNTIYTTFEAVSLVLDHGLSFRVYGLEDPLESESTFVEIATTPSFIGAKGYRLKDGVVTLPSIPFSEASRTFYLRIRTGAYGQLRYSAVLTYSVEAYAAGTSSTVSEEHNALIAALLAYGNSARIYAYERELAMKMQ
ncbi:MAG: hypothetical protein IJY20_04995 [Clostridia bacterium]|nr:hypothetical protein [Clostridia bacterium]